MYHPSARSISHTYPVVMWFVDLFIMPKCALPVAISQSSNVAATSVATMNENCWCIGEQYFILPVFRRLAWQRGLAIPEMVRWITCCWPARGRFDAQFWSSTPVWTVRSLLPQAVLNKEIEWCSFVPPLLPHYASRSATKRTSRFLRPDWSRVGPDSALGARAVHCSTRLGKFVVTSNESGASGWQKIKL